MPGWDDDATEKTAVGDHLRLLLLALLLLGAAGLLAELVLLEHFESAWQWTPLVLLSVVLLVAAVLLVRPSRAGIRIFRVILLLCVVAGAVGVWLHLQGNYQWELEKGEGLTGLRLFLEVLRGATPVLAPGALAQLGLLGLLWTYGHPAARRTHPLRAAGGDPTRTRMGRTDDEPSEKG